MHHQQRRLRCANLHRELAELTDSRCSRDHAAGSLLLVNPYPCDEAYGQPERYNPEPVLSNPANRPFPILRARKESKRHRYQRQRKGGNCMPKPPIPSRCRRARPATRWPRVRTVVISATACVFAFFARAHAGVDPRCGAGSSYRSHSGGGGRGGAPVVKVGPVRFFKPPITPHHAASSADNLRTVG